MNIRTLRGTLLNFIGNPNESWGEPNDGNGNPVDLKLGEQVRRTPDQADFNTARINSGTYTKEQHDDFYRQIVAIGDSGNGTAHFSGDPDNLPESIPERTCSQCNKTFRSAKTNKEVKCYECCLDQLCPVLPGRHITAYWRRDGWWLEGFGDIGFRNEMTFRWSNQTSGGNVCHQRLEVCWTAKGKVRKLVLSSVASQAKRCYRVAFDLEKDVIKFARTDNAISIKSDDVTDHNYAKFVELKELDDLALDLMVAMVPSWMLYAHHPRNPVNGCFAVA